MANPANPTMRPLTRKGEDREAADNVGTSRKDLGLNDMPFGDGDAPAALAALFLPALGSLGKPDRLAVHSDGLI
jgi:hypothetical protein